MNTNDRNRNELKKAIAVSGAILICLVAAVIATYSVEATGTNKNTPETAKAVTEASDAREPFDFATGIMTGADGITAYAAELDEVADIVWLEARGEPTECQEAIAAVIYNRLKSGLWGDTLHDVITADGEFSTIAYLGTAETTPEVRAIVWNMFWDGYDLDEDIMYFRADHYHTWRGAVDEFAIGNTYFSSSTWN